MSRLNSSGEEEEGGGGGERGGGGVVALKVEDPQRLTSQLTDNPVVVSARKKMSARGELCRVHRSKATS